MLIQLLCNVALIWLTVGFLCWLVMCLYAYLRFKQPVSEIDIIVAVPCTILGFITLLEFIHMGITGGNYVGRY